MAGCRTSAGALAACAAQTSLHSTSLMLRLAHSIPLGRSAGGIEVPEISCGPAYGAVGAAAELGDDGRLVRPDGRPERIHKPAGGGGDYRGVLHLQADAGLL